MALLRAVRFAGGTAEVLLEPPRDRVVFRALAAWSKARACARCSGWLTQKRQPNGAPPACDALRGSSRLRRRRLAQFPPLRRRRLLFPHAMPPAQVREVDATAVPVT